MEEDKNGDCYVGSVQYLFGNHCGVSGKKQLEIRNASDYNNWN